MASGIACGCVCMTMTTESPKKVALLQLIGVQRHAALVSSIYIVYWTPMLWSTDTFQNKVSADQLHHAHQGYVLILTCLYKIDS